MLHHLNSSASLPERTVVIGAAGFVGGALVRRLATAKAPTLAVARKDVDLLSPDAAVRLAGLLRPSDAVVAVWGLAYKENTHSVKNSPSLATIAQLPGVNLCLHDPLVPASAARHAKAKGFASALEAAQGADALMILTPWSDYREIKPAEIARNLKGRIVLDPYAVLDVDAAAAAGLRYYTLGRPKPAANGKSV